MLAETCPVPVETGWGVFPRLPQGHIFLPSEWNGWQSHSTFLLEGMKLREVGGVPGSGVLEEQPLITAATQLSLQQEAPGMTPQAQGGSSSSELGPE